MGDVEKELIKIKNEFFEPDFEYYWKKKGLKKEVVYDIYLMAFYKGEKYATKKIADSSLGIVNRFLGRDDGR